VLIFRNKAQNRRPAYGNFFPIMEEKKLITDKILLNAALNQRIYDIRSKSGKTKSA
jgi:hypothetical protein